MVKIHGKSKIELFAVFCLLFGFYFVFGEVAEGDLAVRVNYTGAQAYKLTLTKSQADGKPAALFSCYGDTVYAWLQLPQKATGKHLLEGFWYNPNGVIQERTEVPLDLSPAGVQKVGLWLKFHVERPDIIDAVLPSFDINEEFEGTWKVDVFWDNKKVATSAFTVTCS